MLRETQIDGVTTFVAPTRGAMRAGLTFRVGRADESLPTAGVTHLIEHLALHGHGVADFHYNGATAATFTVFAVAGTADQVVDYLTGVCEALVDLPLQRLEVEKSVLRTEAARRGDEAGLALPMWRFGAQGHGLVSYPEWGLHRLAAHDVRDWAARWFTRENAVLWIAGDDVPPDLSLKLPPGTRMPLPETPSVLPRTPAFFQYGQGGIVLDALVPRGSAAQLYAGVLQRELFRALRQDAGYSYTAEASYQPHSASQAIVTAYADALPKMQDAVVGGFMDVLAKLRAGQLDPAELDTLRRLAEQGFSHPDYDAATLPHRALSALAGRPYQSADELREDMAAVTVEDVTGVATTALETALVQVPRGNRLDWAGLDDAPTHSSSEVNGQRIRSLETDDCVLTIGHDGVSVTSPGGPATVRFDECEALLRWPDGARRLIGRDGIVAHVEPTLFRVGTDTLDAIDAGVGADRTIPMPAREADSIPQPAPTTRPAPLRKPARSAAISVAIATIALVMFIQFANAWRPADGSLAEKAILWLFFGVALAILWALGSVVHLVRSWLTVRRNRA